MYKILFFDTETIGVSRNYQALVTDTYNWPRLVHWQISKLQRNVISNLFVNK